MFGTEVLLLAHPRTSVPDAPFLRLGRKFYFLRTRGLPSRRPLFSVWDGSFTSCAPADFRPGCPFSAFGTEVLLLAHPQTSVPNACFKRLGRKFLALRMLWLPS